MQNKKEVLVDYWDDDETIIWKVIYGYHLPDGFFAWHGSAKWWGDDGRRLRITNFTHEIQNGINISFGYSYY